MLTPKRRRGVELIDDPAIDPRLLVRSLLDVTRANTWFGGTRAALSPLRQFLRDSPDTDLLLLDVGTGLGDIPQRARRVARRRGARLTTIGLERSETLAQTARSAELPMVRADALQLPFRDRSVDVVLCSQLLHHFDFATGAQLVQELTRVARRMVIVSDLRRSWLAAGLFWLASWPLRFERVTRHDGTLSVLRGFTEQELRRLCAVSGARAPRIGRHLGFRLTASWTS